MWATTAIRVESLRKATLSGNIRLWCKQLTATKAFNTAEFIVAIKSFTALTEASLKRNTCAYPSCSLCYKNTTIVNDTSRVIRKMIVIDAPSCGATIVILTTLEVSFMLLDLESIYSKGVTHDDHHLQSSYFYSIGPLSANVAFLFNICNLFYR